MIRKTRRGEQHSKRQMRKLIFIITDMALTLLSFWLTYLMIVSLNTNRISLNFPFSNGSMRLLWLAAGALSVFVYVTFGFYRPMWRFASIPQYMTLVFGTLAYTGFVIVASVFIDRPQSPACFVIFWMILMISIIFYRLLFRLLVNRRSQRSLIDSVPYHSKKKLDHLRVMVIGAGYAGNQIIREMIETRGNRQPVILIDDDPNKKGLFITHVPVIGGRERIVSAVTEYAIDEIILAIPSATRQTIRELVTICQKTECNLRILPLMSDIISGKFSISDIKEVEIEDLLGRDVIRLDLTEMASYLSGQVIMITGGGGSIGSELCRQIAKFKPKQLIIFDIYENNAFELQQELISYYGNTLDLVVLIGSVRDLERLDTVMKAYHPTIVFHAAAHKHVPLMQDSPSEAVKNNVMGTYNMALIAGRYNVSRFVMISTDKAVNPTNVMGASKRLAELTIQYMNRMFPLTTYMAVRFGNVLGSNGSVIPLFKKQIQQNRRVTVTDPDITRYFMTIPEAVSLVIQAGAMANGGEIFVLDMGEPIKIDDLARDLIRLSGLEPDLDVEIVYTGLRPGEKMFEELSLVRELMDRTRHEKIFVMKPILDRKAIEDEITMLKKVIGWDCHGLREICNTIQNTLLSSVIPHDSSEHVGS